MTRLQFNLTMTVAGLALIATVLIIVFGQMNRSLERVALEQRATIDRGNLSQQIGRSLINDMAQVSLRNQKMKDLLARNGFTINVNTNSAPTGAR